MPTDSNLLHFNGHTEIPRAMIFNRSEIRHSIPRIDDMLSELAAQFQSIGQSLPPASCIQVCTKNVDSLFKKHWENQRLDPHLVGTDSLFIYLPDEFEASLAQLVVSSPSVVNRPNPLTQDNTTYLCWYRTLSESNSSTEIRIPYDSMSFSVAHAFAQCKHQNGWMPLVMIAGETIAVGGFLVNMNFFDIVEEVSESLIFLLFNPQDEEQNKKNPSLLVYTCDSVVYSLDY